MPKNPQPGHPLADSAREEAEAIDAMGKPLGSAPPANLPADEPILASDPPQDPPEPRDAPLPGDEPQDDDSLPPIDPRSVARLVSQNDTLLGRLDAESRRNRELEETARRATENREFLEKRAQDLAEENRRKDEELAKLQADRDVSTVVSGFKSEHVDAEAFGDIYRGLHPHLKRFEADIQTRIDKAVEARVATVKTDAEKREVDLRKELNERAIMRDVPEFGKLLDRPDFKDFLAETVPGTRTTRRTEVLGAWRDGDVQFIKDVVTNFKRKGSPQAVDHEPLNHGRQPQDQSPRQPTPEPQIDEDQLGVYFQQMNEEKITVAQYRKYKATYDKQQLERWRRSRRSN